MSQMTFLWSKQLGLDLFWLRVKGSKVIQHSATYTEIECKGDWTVHSRDFPSTKYLWFRDSFEIQFQYFSSNWSCKLKKKVLTKQQNAVVNRWFSFQKPKNLQFTVFPLCVSAVVCETWKKLHMHWIYNEYFKRFFSIFQVFLDLN